MAHGLENTEQVLRPAHVLLRPQEVHPGPQEKWLRAGPQRPAVSEPGAPCGCNQYSNSTLGAAPDGQLQTRALHFAAAAAPVT